MKTNAIIMEINPLHNGHIHFINQIPKNEQDILIAIISTNLTQRGEISVLDKRTKTKLLLEKDIDIVVELPSYFTNQGGYYFAKSALHILEKLGVTDLYFGSESNDLNYLQSFAGINQEQQNFKNGIHKTQLKNLKSNDILGVSYLKNITNITPHTIKRVSNQYNTINLTGNISSATSIRENINDPNIKTTLPPDSYNSLKIIDENILIDLFLININYVYKNKINIFLSEDMQLTNKLYKLCCKNDLTSLKDITAIAKDKNNSKYKIRRIINNVVLLQTKISENPYVKVLGFSKKGQKYLKNYKYITSLKEIDSPIKDYEIQLSNLLYRHNLQPKNVDFLKPIIKGE